MTNIRLVQPSIRRGECATGHVTEDEVFQAFGCVVNKLIEQRPAVVAACEEILESLMSTGDLDARKERLVAERESITEKVEALMTKASRQAVVGFEEQYAVLERDMKRVLEKLDTVERERSEREYKGRQCKLFLKTLDKIGTRENDEELFLALVDKVIVGEGMRFILRDGTEWEI